MCSEQRRMALWVERQHAVAGATSDRTVAFMVLALLGWRSTLGLFFTIDGLAFATLESAGPRGSRLRNARRRHSGARPSGGDSVRAKHEDQEPSQ
jgi:hypothetical protein